MAHHGFHFPLADIRRWCAFGFLLALGLSAILGMVGLRDGSFLHHKTSGEMVFRKRLSERAFLAVLPLLLILGTLSPLLFDLFGGAEGRGSRTAWLGLRAFFALAGVLVGGLLLWIGQPEELRLDRERRTYRLTRGWPASHVSSGAWEDIGGVSVRDIGSMCQVDVGWKRGRGRPMVLGRFNRRKRADALAAELSAILGVPRVAPPMKS